MKYILVRENVITLKMMAHIISTKYELHLKSESELNTTKFFLKFVVTFFMLCCSLPKRLCMGKVRIYGASYSSGMSNKVKQAIVQRCTCFKGLIFLELKE